MNKAEEFIVKFYNEWSQNWDLIIDRLGEETANELDDLYLHIIEKHK